LKNKNQRKKSIHNSKKKTIRADFSNDIWGQNKSKKNHNY